MTSETPSRQSGGNNRGTRQTFGSVRRLASGRFQARYTGPDKKAYRAPVTFETKGDANAWLALRHSEVVRQQWAPEVTGRANQTFEGYARRWIAERPLKPRTRSDYLQIFERDLRPAFGSLTLSEIDRDVVRSWYAGFDAGKPTARARAYGLLRTVLGSAVSRRFEPHGP